MKYKILQKANDKSQIIVFYSCLCCVAFFYSKICTTTQLSMFPFYNAVTLSACIFAVVNFMAASVPKYTLVDLCT